MPYTPMTGLSDPAPSLADHLLDIRHWRVHDLNPFQAAKLPESECQLAEIWRRILQGEGAQMYTQASSKHVQRLKECINKDIWLTIYKFVIIAYSCPFF